MDGECYDRKAMYGNAAKYLIKDGNGCISFNEFVWLMTR